MLNFVPRKYRTEDDDHAPVDYRFVPSVAEGERLRQAAPIHQEEVKASVRHRAEPDTPAGDGSTQSRAAQAGEPRGYEAARRLPRAGDTPAAASVAYPRPRDNLFAQSPAYTARPAQPLPATPEPSRSRAPQTFAPRVAASGQPSVRTPANAPPQIAPQAYAERQPMGDLPQAGRSVPAANWANPVEAPADNRVERRRSPSAGAATPDPYSAQPQGRWSAPVEPGDSFAPDGSQYAPPTAQEVPEWLKMASHNHMPYDEEHRRRIPRVERAPQEAPAPVPTDPLGRPLTRRNAPQPDAGPRSMAEAYEAAGYPPELIEQQRTSEDQLATDPSIHRRRHGAQLAAPPPPTGERRQAPRRDSAFTPDPRARGGYPEAGYGEPERSRQNFAPLGATDPRYGAADPNSLYGAVSYQVETVEDRRTRRARDGENPDGTENDPEEETPRRQIPWLGIAAFAAALLVVGLWIAQITFTGQTQAVLTARAATQQKLVDKHPYSYRELIEREAEANNLHPAFVAAIVLNESSFNPKAESDVGARGLMQMMPDTAQWVHDKMGLAETFSFDQMYDPDTNVHYACWYLAYLSDRFRADPILVSAAFHAGQNTVQNWLNDSRYSTDRQTISLEKMAEGPTRNYATRVLKDFATYRRLYYEGGLEAATAATAAGAETARSAVLPVVKTVSMGAAVTAAR